MNKQIDIRAVKNIVVPIFLVALLLIMMGQRQHLLVIQSRLEALIDIDNAAHEEFIALNKMSELARDGDYLNAEDLLRFSLRMSPGSIDTFQYILKEATVSINTMKTIEKEEHMFDISLWVQELMGASESMIPFLDFENIPKARNDWIAVYESLDIVNVNIEVEGNTLELEYYSEVKPNVDYALEYLSKWLGKYANSEINEVIDDVSKLDHFIEQLVLLYEVVGEFAMEGFEIAKEDYDLLGSKLIELNRIRVWSYNHNALKVLQLSAGVHKRDDQFGKPQLLDLARLDESRFIPYIQQEFQRVWNLHFEGIPQADKEEVIKAQILKTVRE